jgi:hypothetical protein
MERYLRREKFIERIYMYDAELLQGYVIKTLDKMLQSGAALPIYLVSVGANGAMYYCRFIDDGKGSFDAEVLARYGQKFDPPINQFFMDITNGIIYRAVAAYDATA